MCCLPAPSPLLCRWQAAQCGAAKFIVEVRMLPTGAASYPTGPVTSASSARGPVPLLTMGPAGPTVRQHVSTGLLAQASSLCGENAVPHALQGGREGGGEGGGLVHPGSCYPVTPRSMHVTCEL